MGSDRLFRLFALFFYSAGRPFIIVLERQELHELCERVYRMLLFHTSGSWKPHSRAQFPLLLKHLLGLETMTVTAQSECVSTEQQC